MTTAITLESIKAEQTKLAEMIANFEKLQAATPAIYFPEATIGLKSGEHYAGLILSKDGEPSYHLILLPGDAESIDWSDAKAWATGQGGELPTRREQSLLFANLKEEFQGAWYWSSEESQSASGCAWRQCFSYGSQTSYHESGELRARAVRRLIIE